MTLLTIPALVVALSAQAPLAPVTLASGGGPSTASRAPASHYRANRSGYSKSRRYSSRRGRLSRSSRYADNYLKKSGVTFTIRGGHHDLIQAKDGFGALAPRGSFGYAWGYNVSPFVNFGIGVDGLFYGANCAVHGPVKGVGQVNVTMDAIFRLIRPSERRYLVPYLQVGMGLALLSATVTRTETTRGSDGEPVSNETENSVLLSRGGIFQVGGGLEIFLTRFLSLNVRALYRVQPMSGLRCLEGAACDPTRSLGQRNLQGFSADAGFTFHFSSL